MGRATEYFDYLNAKPEDLAERKDLYCSLTVRDEYKPIRREYLKLRRKKG